MSIMRTRTQSQTPILVSIILTESTASLLELRTQPNIEDVGDIVGSSCVIKPVDIDDYKHKLGVLSFFFSQNDASDICSDIAYFSKTFGSDSDISVDSESDDEDETPKMDPIKIFTRPHLIAKSIAHQNKIFIENNEIHISMLEHDLSTFDSEMICRICHGGESLGDLLAPCRCRGSIALAHIECLEHWLKESSNSYCELCQHHYQIIREPRYSVPWSILMYLSHPGENLKDLILDAMAFIIYTPSALVSSYMLMLLCESIAKSQMNRTRNVSAHLVAFCAVFGMAAIDFTYSSWLIMTFQRHTHAWRTWCRNNSFLKLVLPEWKKRPIKVVRHFGKNGRKDQLKY